MNGFEYRRQLPEVLDEVHRRTLASHFLAAGFEMQTDSWAELEDVNAEYDRRVYESGEEHGYDILSVKYGGTQVFGPLLGEPQHLVESGPTEYALESDRWVDLGGWKTRRQILIRGLHRPTSSDTPSRILLIPDVPPVAMHGDDYAYVTQKVGLRTIGNDGRLLAEVENAFGPEAIEFVNEDAARSLMQALLRDSTSVPTTL